MRWLVLALVLAAAPADARKPMPRLPVFAEQCQAAASIEALETCLHKLGTPTLLRAFAHARVYRVDQDRGDGERFAVGIALYVEREHGWMLGGQHERRGQEFDVLDAAPLVVGKHTGYRIDIVSAMHTRASIDGFTSVPAVLTLRRAMLCAGTTWRCTEVVASCDVLVRGATLWTFHGSLTFTDSQVHVDGDRTKAGTMCSTPSVSFIGWPQP